MKKMNLKKLLAGALALTLAAVLLAGCGQSKPADTGQQPPAEEAGAAQGEPDKAVYHVGLIQLVEHPSLNTIRDSTLAEIVARGYGDVILVEVQNAQNDQSNINTIAQKFVGDEKDLICAIATLAAQGAAAATKDIPVVFSAITDPIAAKLVSDLEKPGGNVTGTSDALPVDAVFELAAKLTPDAKTFGLLSSAGEANSASTIESAKKYCDANGIQYVEVTVTNSSEVQQAAQSLIGKVDAIFTPTDNTIATAMPVLAQICNEAKIPVYPGADSMVGDGGFATTGIEYTQLGKQTAEMIIDILINGKSPANMPVQTMKNFSVFINPTTAEAIGKTIPGDILSTAVLIDTTKK